MTMRRGVGGGGSGVRVGSGEGDRERENRFDSLGSSGRLSLWCDCSVDGSSGVVVGAAVIMMENADSASRVSPSR